MSDDHINLRSQDASARPGWPGVLVLVTSTWFNDPKAYWVSEQPPSYPASTAPPELQTLEWAHAQPLFLSMSETTISLLARFLGWLPLRANHMLGNLIGRLMWLSNSKPRRITEVNLKLCFPDMPESERTGLAYESLLETGKQLTECAWVWSRPVEQSLEKIVEIKGQEHLKQAQISERGVIAVSPHLGNWELCTLPLSRAQAFTYFYRSPRNKALGSLLVAWRAHLGGQPATLDASGIREGLKILKKGGTVGILPDQEPDRQNGEFAPFFKQPALTMTLLSRLANRSKAHVLFCVAERLPKARGWRIHIVPASPLVASDDIPQAISALNEGVEQCIALLPSPSQYLWDYKRFNTLENGTTRQYQ